jgi:hypothetical protein
MQYLFIALCLSAFQVLIAQNTNLNSPVSEKPLYTLEDTIISVTCHQEESNRLPPALFVNGTFQEALLNGGVNLEKITDIRIIRDTVEIDNKVYYGKVMIELEKDYRPRYLSVSEMICKYTKLSSIPDILMIDDEIISCNFDESYIDEHYMLSIDVRKTRSATDGDPICIVRMSTRTEDNVKKANTIYLRGMIDDL